MRNAGTVWIIAAILFLIDLYVFSAVKTITQQLSDKAKLAVYICYWCITIVAVLTILTFPYIQALSTNKFFRNYVFAILMGLFIAKVVAAILLLIDDVRRLGTYTAIKIGSHIQETASPIDGVAISRSVFMSWLGIGIGSILFGTLLWGFRNKYAYQLKKVVLKFPNLPAAFNGFTLIHISDIHSGSFQNKAAVSKGIEMILKQNAEAILFTADLVNDRADEIQEYQSIFAKLTAPYGVFSVLGNHDYGDYVQWNSPEAKHNNLEKLKALQKDMGWKLLMNEHTIFEKDQEKIALLGIENWGAKGRFPKYGKLKEAIEGTENIVFKILMSHDPSHWDAEVKPQYPSVDLMLSGHTHGMQFGLSNPYFKWSPVQWMYKQWAGLYETGNQKLYVNPGFGFIGYPGRVGILPEITRIELRKT